MGDVAYDFGDETVVVTGGSSGIGRQIAFDFADSGATTIIGDVQRDPNIGDTPTHQEIEDRGGTAVYRKTDVSVPSEVCELIATAAEFGGVDVMVNNAGVYFKEPIREATEGTLDKHYDVNVKGVYFGCQAAANSMIERGVDGTIVNMGSISAEVGQGEGIAHYEASKGAVRMITRGLAVELAEHDIRVNAVAPGVVPTELYEGYSEKFDSEDALSELVKPVPLNRAGTAEEVAHAVLFLASDDASYTTGELLFVDGGWMAI